MASQPDIRALDAFVGTWEFEASVDARPAVRGRTRFEWVEGADFVVQRAEADPPTADTPREWIENSPFPLSTVYGIDDPSGTFSMLYADVRGVHRVYDMSVDGDTWTITGQAGPEFFQRFTGTFEAGDTFAGRWERSTDGSTWETDFDIVYRRADDSRAASPSQH